MQNVIYLSVVIPAFNEAQTLVSNLNRVNDALKEAFPPKWAWEIIVCDNNSKDDTSQVAKYWGAIVVREPQNQISRARNTGAANAKGTWLLFLDADSYPTPGLVQDLVAVMESGNFVGCGTTVKVEGGTVFNRLRMERLNPIFRLLNIAGGVCLLCERKAFEQVEGFSLELYAYEEFDFIRRLKKYGRSIGKRFTVLHQNPIVTSGRKGELTPNSLFRMLTSNVLALLLYILRPLLPSSLIKTLGQKGLRFWYQERNKEETK